MCGATAKRATLSVRHTSLHNLPPTLAKHPHALAPTALAHKWRHERLLDNVQRVPRRLDRGEARCDGVERIAYGPAWLLAAGRWGRHGGLDVVGAIDGCARVRSTLLLLPIVVSEHFHVVGSRWVLAASVTRILTSSRPCRSHIHPHHGFQGCHSCSRRTAQDCPRLGLQAQTQCPANSRRSRPPTPVRMELVL